VNSLKVDRVFVAGLRRGTHNAAIVRAIVMLGGSLGKKIIAEGIETSAEMEQLRQMGCDCGQGFHLSRPLAPELVERLLDAIAASPHAAPSKHAEPVALLH
jgi:EAL domain-containing protein (putative c-di-GMP-specific phosphodiesterase class I)